MTDTTIVRPALVELKGAIEAMEEMCRTFNGLLVFCEEAAAATLAVLRDELPDDARAAVRGGMEKLASSLDDNRAVGARAKRSIEAAARTVDQLIEEIG